LETVFLALMEAASFCFFSLEKQKIQRTAGRAPEN